MASTFQGWVPRVSPAAFALLCVIAAADESIFDDRLSDGWEDWSWATVDWTVASPVRSGANAVSVTAAAWDGFYLHHAAMNTAGFTNLAFWIHGGAAGGQRLLVQAIRGTNEQPVCSIPALAADWQQISIPLATLGVSNVVDFTGFWIQDRSGTAQPVFYLDDLALLGAGGGAVTCAEIRIRIDAAAGRHPIDPRIYGVAFATSSELARLNAPLNRSGGNSETRYSWQINAHNHAADWYFESLPDDSATAGAAADAFVRASRGGGAEPMLTIPMIGWAPKLGAGRQRLASYSIAKYGPQTDRDWSWFPDAGNGMSVTNNTPITWNDPDDANTPVGVTFQSNWVQHLLAAWGPSTNGGVRYYFLDNEHSLWHSTHRDVHPVGATMEEIRDRMAEYAAMIKSSDPSAVVLGPEEWGWSGYLYSGYDQQYGATHGWSSFPDREAHEGADYLPWLLDQMRQCSVTAGRRLLDVFTVHYYPQGGEFGANVGETMQLRRNRSTRSLWDTNYVDESWINAPVGLIPRLKRWVAESYPGTPVGITEYNWGAEDHINGATAQADILGIFGREGLDMANRWTTPDSSSPAFLAICMYRNYDGARSTFGDTSVRATGGDPDACAVFASERSVDGALTIMAVNKSFDAITSAVFAVTNFIAAGTAQVWRLSSLTNAIVRQSDLAVTHGAVSTSLPAQSITLMVLPAGDRVPRFGAIARQPGGTIEARLDGLPGRRYALEASAGDGEWGAVATNQQSAVSVWIPLPATNDPVRLYRALELP